MNKIVKKEQLAEKIFRLEIEAPQIAKSQKVGNFVIVRVGDFGERMPIPITDANTETGTITLVVKTSGLSSTKLCRLNEGDYVTDVVGPLGTAVNVQHYGTIICATEGVCISAMLPIIKAMKAAGNRVLAVLSGINRHQIVLEEEVRQHSDETIVLTAYGGYGEKGIATDGVERFLKQEKVDKAFVFGLTSMMKDCCQLTQQYNVPTDVSFTALMVDGTGMCGACRLTVGGKMKFTCIDGPVFDGALINWVDVQKNANAIHHADQVSIKLIDRMNAQKETVEFTTDIKMDVEPTDEPVEMLCDRDAEWRKELRTQMKPKERTAIPRVVMPTLDPEYRIKTRFEEVNKGLTKEMALLEAKRCLDCAKPGCVEGCPANNDIPSFIKNIERGQFLAAAKVLHLTTSLPAVCGRVCPQEKQCEGNCIHLKMGGKAVAIGNLERFVADFERDNQLIAKPEIAPSNGIKVAAIGSGPAGLSFAGDMVKKGYEVHVFEAFHELGGVMKYGIPEYRLPNRIVDVEIENLKKMGVQFHTNCVVGKTVTAEELKEQGFAGIFVATGAGVPNFMGIPGENALNVISYSEYLLRVNLMEADHPNHDTPIYRGKNVLVVGGGNTAMDSCRTAKRLGANVTLVYRRSEAEMPCGIEEIKEAKEEGVEFLTLHNPIEYISDENGSVKAAVLQVMELGEPDESGRRSPVPVEGKTITLDVDQVIVAVGVLPNPLVPQSIKGLELGWKSTIVVNEQMQSSIPTIYAGGDIVRGGATVILAMGDGRRAALNMDKQLQETK